MKQGLEELGGKIRRLRMERGISQDRLAIEANVDQSGLSKFERGVAGKNKLGPVPLRRIATILRTTFDELVSGTNYDRAAR